MIIHIVKPNETIYDIAKLYNISTDEIKSANTHFRSWEHLAPGVKIKLPEIPEYVSEEIDLIEPFIEDYYPQIDSEMLKISEEIQTDSGLDKAEVQINNENKSSQSKTKSNKYYKYPYYMYYGYPYFRKR